MSGVKIEFELRFIVDVTKPVTQLERESLYTMLEAAEDHRAARGVTQNPDIDRVRATLNGHPVTGAALALPSMRDVTRDLLLAALRRHHGNRTHAAREIGLTVRTVRNRLRAEHIDLPAGYCVHDAEGNPL